MAQSESRADEEVTAATVETPVATNDQTEHNDAAPKEPEPKEPEPKEPEPKEPEPKEPAHQESDEPEQSTGAEDSVTTDTVVVALDDPVEEAKEKIGDALENVGEELFSAVMEKVKAKAEEIGLEPSTLPRVIGLVMEAIEDTPVKGRDQLLFAVKVIDVLIDELPDGDAKTLLKKTSASGGIAGTIELVVLATRGELNVNAVLENTEGCVTPCCNFFLSKIRGRRSRQ